MKLNKRMLFGIISIALAAVVALIGIPAVIGRTETKVNIVRVKSPIERGTVIRAEQVETVQISSAGLPQGVATDTSQVVGTYALVDLVAGDYFLPAKVSSRSPEKDTVLSRLTGEYIAVSVSVKSMAGVLANKLKADDIVGIYTVTEEGAVKPRELQYVRIIALTNSNGVNIEDATGDESRIASTVTFLVTDMQAARLIEIENSSRMHLTLVSRGDAKRAEKLLSEQRDILDEIEAEEDLGSDLDTDFDFDFGEYEVMP